MDRQKVLDTLGGCFYGEPASCSYACPFRLDLRSFLKKMSKGRFDAAYKELCAVIPLPEIAARLCGGMCRGSCQCAAVLGGEPVQIPALERSCIRLAKRREIPVYALPEKPQRIAVVGAGTAGLSCALTLARKKYRVTVFDRAPGWGGRLREDGRFAELDADIAYQFAKETLDFRYGAEIRELAELSDFDAVLVATGAGGESFGLLSGWDAALLTTGVPGVFLCGGAAGQDSVSGMAAGARCARSVEAWLQTGNAANAAETWDEKNACRYVPHEGVEPSRAATPDEGESYSAAAAMAEAARCLQCDCKTCMNVCELMQTYKKAPPRVSSDVLQDALTRNSVSTAAITRETWSCNLCGRCAAKCPVGTDVGEMLRLSRESRVEQRQYPPAIHAYWLSEMAFAAGDGALTIPSEGRYVFFPGCRLGAANPEYVTRSFDVLREGCGAGLMLNCCGISALWAGERELFERHCAALLDAWRDMGRPTFVLACASCARTFRKYMPMIPTVSLYSLLPPENAAGLPGWDSAAVFDPCAAEEREEKDAVRCLAAAAGVAVTPFDSDGRCCGYGGHMMLANPKLYGQIAENRVSVCEEPFVVYCVNCRETFRARGKRCVHVLDLYFALDTPPTTLDEKRRNSVMLKKTLALRFGLSVKEPPKQPWDAVSVCVGEQLQLRMEAQLIPMDSVRRVLYEAERSGTGFVADDGTLLCSSRLDALTVWVMARRREDGIWELEDVYSHRMDIGGAP